MKMTRAQRKQLTEYYKRGYTMAIINAEGDLVPGYSDWIIEFVLETEYDELGQAYRSEGVSCDTLPQKADRPG